MKLPLVALTPAVLVTCTVAGPAVPVGVTAVRRVALATETPVAGVPPTVTLASLVKLLPVTVIVVPPAVPPSAGVTALTVGSATMVKLLVAGDEALPAASVAVTETVLDPSGRSAPGA